MASASSTVRLRLAFAKDSVALAKTATRRAPSARARSRPRSFGTRTGRCDARADRAPAGTAARRRRVGAPTWGARSSSPRSSSAPRRPGGGRTPPSPRWARSPSRSAGRHGRRPRGSGPAAGRSGAGTTMGRRVRRVIVSSSRRGDDGQHLVHGDRRARRDVQFGDRAGVRGGDDVLHLHRLDDQQALTRGHLVPDGDLHDGDRAGHGRGERVGARVPGAGEGRGDRVVVAHLPGVAVAAQPGAVRQWRRRCGRRRRAGG